MLLKSFCFIGNGIGDDPVSYTHLDVYKRQGHYSDIVGTILQVETLAHFQPRYFGDGVWLIRIFQRGGEESILLQDVYKRQLQVIIVVLCFTILLMSLNRLPEEMPTMPSE